MRDWFSKCGCNCGRCPAFKANAKTEKDRQRCSDGWFKYLNVRVRPDICFCQGCQSPDPWESGAVLPDRGCYVRPCAIKTGVENCAHCGWFPCEELKRRIPGEEFREITETRMGAPVSEEDYVAFLEPYEGVKHLSEIRATLKQEEIVEKPDVAPLRARIAKFPDDLPSSEEEVLRSLHGVFVNVLTAPAETYAKQIIIKRLRKTLLNTLWIFARFGELKNRELVVDGSAHGRRDDLRNIVRRTDNTLHASTTAAARILEDYGVRFKHVPVKKYALKMSFDKSAGGIEGLKALRRYGAALIEKYGEPEYAGASRFKGEAYAQFSKADMRVLKSD
jgi:hypothetical protein